MNNPVYYQQVQLLLKMLPHIAKEPCFALKGGTAINLFVRDFPRLSVDIDLVYLPDDNRTAALENIQGALNRVADGISAAVPFVQLIKSYENKRDALRLVASQQGVQVQVELSPVLRGTVFPSVNMSVHEKVEDEFGYAQMQVVALEALYAGKLCAAFDRQHPRDFFDVLLLLENEGITDGIRQAFLVYLASHPRPAEELLNPNWKDITEAFHQEFLGMTNRKPSILELETAAKTALNQLVFSFTDVEKEFLFSLYSEEPRWDYLPFQQVEHLPAIQWKLLNISKMSAEKRTMATKRLRKVLETPMLHQGQIP